jgi:hypothetical protein
MANRGLAMTTTRMTLTELNALDQDEFAAKLAFLFEGTPWVAAQAWHARPFSNLAHLHRILSSVMFNAPHERQVALIAAHPDLAGKAALAGALSPESTGEQAVAGLNWLLPDEMAASRSSMMPIGRPSGSLSSSASARTPSRTSWLPSLLASTTRASATSRLRSGRSPRSAGSACWTASTRRTSSDHMGTG